VSRNDADWPPLWHDDPTPGDPDEVAELGRKLRKMADMIDEQSRVIKALASVEGWDSEAGKGFHELADGAADKLKKSFERYDEAAKAVGEEVREVGSDQFASEMRRAQRRTFPRRRRRSTSAGSGNATTPGTASVQHARR
jgi:hypothetical protein